MTPDSLILKRVPQYKMSSAVSEASEIPRVGRRHFLPAWSKEHRK
jgi:hypothetical protein